MRSRPQSLAAAAFVSLALLASACGSSSEPNTSVAGPAVNGPAAVAAANIDNLATSDDVRLIEVLDVDSGETTTISDAVDGDRPVLLWFWAPH